MTHGQVSTYLQEKTRYIIVIHCLSPSATITSPTKALKSWLAPASAMAPKRRTKAPICCCGCSRIVPASRTRNGKSWRVRIASSYVVCWSTQCVLRAMQPIRAGKKTCWLPPALTLEVWHAWSGRKCCASTGRAEGDQMDTGACSQPALGCGGAEQVHDAPVGWPFGMARTDGDSCRQGKLSEPKKVLGLGRT